LNDEIESIFVFLIKLTDQQPVGTKTKTDRSREVKFGQPKRECYPDFSKMTSNPPVDCFGVKIQSWLLPSRLSNQYHSTIDSDQERTSLGQTRL
jgi:hypothetical protein